MRIDDGEIYVRLVGPEDAQAQLDLLVRNREFFKPFEPRRPPEQFTLVAQRTQLAESATAAVQGHEYPFGVFLTEGDLLIGRVNLSKIVRRAFLNAYLGYYLDQAHNGRGYTSRSVSAVVDFAFGPGGLHRVQAAVMPENKGSMRVLEKAGFRHEGFAPNYLRIDDRWRDHELFAITVEDRAASGNLPGSRNL